MTSRIKKKWDQTGEQKIIVLCWFPVKSHSRKFVSIQLFSPKRRDKKKKRKWKIKCMNVYISPLAIHDFVFHWICPLLCISLRKILSVLREIRKWRSTIFLPRYFTTTGAFITTKQYKACAKVVHGESKKTETTKRQLTYYSVIIPVHKKAKAAKQ